MNMISNKESIMDEIKIGTNHMQTGGRSITCERVREKRGKKTFAVLRYKHQFQFFGEHS